VVDKIVEDGVMIILGTTRISTIENKIYIAKNKM